MVGQSIDRSADRSSQLQSQLRLESNSRCHRPTMCTLIVIHRAVPGRWLVVAANRDEYLDRPAEGPTVRRTSLGPVLAPLDLRAGGTWLGLNPHGVFAALTNLRTPDLDPTRKSRGSVVMDALARRTAIDAAEGLAALPEGLYNGFNCLIADRKTAHVVTYRNRAIVHRLSPGVHVVGNADAALQSGKSERGCAPEFATDDRQRKVDRIHARARDAAELPADDVLDALAGICREHGSGRTPLDDTCVHMSDTHHVESYGTRSSILLELSDEPGSSRLLHSTGAPCTTPYQEVSSLLDELRQAPGYGSAEFSTRTAT
jgi:uncharacterized protein with NRDE domain